MTGGAPDWPYLRSYLYVSGAEPSRMRKAIASAADGIVLDLEDSVPLRSKASARANVASILERSRDRAVFVRINPPSSDEVAKDLKAVNSLPVTGIWLPKVEWAHEVRRVADVLSDTGSEARLHCLIETAAGLSRIGDIARAHERVSSIGLGERDLSSSLGIRSEGFLSFMRASCVVAARAAGLPAPVMSVYPTLGDLPGLRATTLGGRDSGFFGRSAIHPSQVGVINEVFTPTKAQIGDAKEIVAALRDAEEEGRGAVALSDGRFIDAAVVRGAEETLARARAMGLV